MKCSMCGHQVPKGRGKMLVRNDGKLVYFCGSKCHKNYDLGRQGKNLKWTGLFEKG